MPLDYAIWSRIEEDALLSKEEFDLAKEEFFAAKED